ncbi:MAG: DUF1861 family protein [Calditrichaeota bacterium]|nr:DUF1861 family protein [Calditrichota bacterium]
MPNGELLQFNSRKVLGKDVYNPTAPFEDRGKIYLAARVESRDSETDSQVMFFLEQNGIWKRDPETPVFALQDPFVSKIQGELVFGGVKFPVENNSWRTEFYRGKDLLHLKKITEGPLAMKDIRLVELADGRVGVFTRPMGEIGGRGKIGFMILNSPDELAIADLWDAEILEGQFSEEQWGGVNAAYFLSHEKIGVLGHFAYFSTLPNGEQIKHYHAIAFIFDYQRWEWTPFQIIARRRDFSACDAKRSPELDDVVLPGGIQFLGDGMAELYAGLSDVACGKLELKDPFVKLC